jgi:DNA repair protein RadC
MSENSPISVWAEDDRPREKLMLKGRQALSDAELIAILIGSGSRELSAVQLAQQILQSTDNQLHTLGKMNVEELMKFKGIGEAKAISIIAALELGRRRRAEERPEKTQIRASKDAYDILQPLIADLPHEEFWILLLNRANKVTGKECVSRGGVSGTVVDTKIIFKVALDRRASSIILAHNHPSGNLKPSPQDLSLTKRIVEAGKFLDIPALDHLIISEAGYYSFADEGQLN